MESADFQCSPLTGYPAMDHQLLEVRNKAEFQKAGPRRAAAA